MISLKNDKFNNWNTGRRFMHNFFPAAGSKDFQNKTGQRFIFDNICYALFWYIAMVNLWYNDKRTADNII